MNEIQSCQLDILREVDRICKENKISYVAYGGTLLGAIRHKGFIPWDDDIDIAMPRKDFDVFCNIASEKLRHPYELLFNKKSYPAMMYAKVHNTQTTFIEQTELADLHRYKGIFIDIMPLDGMPKSSVGRKIYTTLIRNLVRAMTCHKMISVYGKEKMTAKEKVVCVLPYRFYYFLWDRIVGRFDFEKSEFTTASWSVNAEKRTMPTNYFTNTAIYQFEDFFIPGSADYDGYLKIHYGNYMQLPPEDKRYVHGDGGIIDVNKSYKEYIKEMTQK